MLALSLLPRPVFPQAPAARAGISSVGNNTPVAYPLVSKDDWEEINFEFDHAVLTDGFPSLLRLAELLNQNPANKVKLEGHGDQIGNDAYNMHLGLRRADAVRDFLVKYGARPAQIETTSKGKRDPKVADLTPAARFMNRRVAVTVTDKDGKLISAGGVGDAIKAIGDQLNKLQAMNEQCCSDILKKLDKLDDILAALRNLRNENADLKKQLEGVKSDQSKLGADLDKLAKGGLAAGAGSVGPGGPMGPGGPAGPGGLTSTNQTAGLTGPGGAAGAGGPSGPGGPGGPSGVGGGPGGPGAGGQGGAGGTGKDGKNGRTERASRDSGLSALTGGPSSKIQILGANVGADDLGKLTFTGRARYFSTFKENFAVQAQGEYMYFRDRQEGQFDLGLVARVRRNIQAGLFSSFKTVNMRQYNNNGTLGQAALAVDWLTRRGKFGLFGTKAFLDEAVVDRRKISPSFTLETFLKAVDQVGVSGSHQLWKNNFVEGNIGYLHGRGVASRPGGTLRFVFPVNSLFALTLEGGMNETLLGSQNNGRVVGGILFGNFMQPREYLAADGPVPMDVPRVRYEVLSRKIRTGYVPPVADAGPDQIGIAAGTVTLDGTGSYSPDGLKLSYEWRQVAGNSVAIQGVNSAKATFQAGENQQYAFRLQVTDEAGAIAVARTVVTTRADPEARIVQFVANPAIIRAGQSSSLAWQVENADTVEIAGIGRVDAKAGTVSVSPNETTTYRLTARNRKGELNSTVTVTVERQLARVLNFSASPMTITAGQSSTLSWATENAETVEIAGIGRVGLTGSQQVSPTSTTTYTLNVRNREGSTTANVTVQVQPLPLPRIMRFLAAPPEIFNGETSTLVWSVDNADEVRISNVGVVEASGTNAVSPTQNTTYTLVAKNASGESRATVDISVYGPPRITAFSASPSTIKAGEASTLRWSTTDATSVTISGLGTVPPNGSVEVKPTSTTTYTLTAVGRRNNTVSQQVVVTVDPGSGGGGGGGNPPGGRPPIADAGPNQVTLNRIVQLDGSKSYHPDGKAIRFSWRVVGLPGVQEIRGADTARPTVIFFQYAAFGEYTFELTVTDADGRSAVASTKVNFASY